MWRHVSALVAHKGVEDVEQAKAVGALRHVPQQPRMCDPEKRHSRMPSLPRAAKGRQGDTKERINERGRD
jgi:hypothetical protein